MPFLYILSDFYVLILSVAYKDMWKISTIILDFPVSPFSDVGFVLCILEFFLVGMFS